MEWINNFDKKPCDCLPCTKDDRGVEYYPFVLIRCHDNNIFRARMIVYPSTYFGSPFVEWENIKYKLGGCENEISISNWDVVEWATID